MKPEPFRWREVDAALGAVLAASADERDAVLDRAVGGDGRLRSEVESLLAAHARAGDFLESPVLEFAAPFLDAVPDPTPSEELEGTTIGRWTVRREIGRGGFGRVYLAERADGLYEQRAALKLIKRGMDSDEIVARFVRERRILARLEHPHIARLLDGGVTDDGRPYFVMEHVEGLPITERCQRSGLGVDARLRLFVTVCRAVQHAHRNLVVHRDLKPSNVLVTETGEVKLLDFGIAKLLEEGDEAATATAFAGARLLTPEYASPEQIAGETMTTASDVYQLGVLLYELLTGERPHSRGDGDRAALLAAVREREPRRPSTAVRQGGRAAEALGTTGERLARRLRGDLDAVVLRALARQPESRYRSAEELAVDLERHLEHQPVQARQAGVADQAWKFVRRHRVAVATGALFLAFALASGAFYAVRVSAERDRALREAEKAMESARLLQGFFRGWDPDTSDRQATSASHLFAVAVRQAERELEARPENLAATLSVMGDLHTSIGETATADELLARAAAIQERLPGGPSADLAATLARRARLQIERGDVAGAVAAYRRSLELHRAALGETHVETIAVEIQLARTLWMAQRAGEAEALLRGTIAREATIAPAVELGLEARDELAYALFEQARYDEAVELLRESLAGCRSALGELHPLTARTMHHLAAALRAPAQLSEAEALAREGFRITRDLYGDGRIETAHSALGLAVLLERKGDFEEAERWARRASERDPERPDQIQAALHLRTLGGIRLVRGDAAGAEALLRRSLEMMRRLFPAGAHADEGDVLNRLAFLVGERRAADADEIYAQAVAFERARGDGPYFVTDGYDYLARAALARGDRALAEALFRRAAKLYDAELPADHPYRTATAAGLAALAVRR